MKTPGWWSQPFPPEGAITSEGIRNQLGRPAVDPLTVFVRESAQNSWDARLGAGPVQYLLDVEAVPASHRRTWRELLSRDAPASPSLALADSLSHDGLRILAVSDRGTKGLAGPTRANVASDGARDWMSFVLNIGERRDTVGGGGTYGYGKAVFYRLSRAGTVLIHTRTLAEAGLTTRLIGVALGESFVLDGVPYTGRHWWGDRRGDHVEPLVDADADAAAEVFGIPPFLSDETGTTVIVVDPDFGEGSDDKAVARHLADTIAWQLWPLMLPERGDDRLEALVTCLGEEYLVPDPTETYPLDMFVRAYRDVVAGQGTIIECQRPRQRLGALALQRRAVAPRASGVEAARNAGVGGDPHHVCLLRSPELVVTYFEGPEPFSTSSAYAGVFRAADELDDTFAAAEPPTHDDWVVEQLVGRDKTFVRQTKNRILAELREFVRPAMFGGAGTSVPLGAASNYLGSLVAASAGGGAQFSLGDTSRPGGRDGVGGRRGSSGTAPPSVSGDRPTARAAPIGDPAWQRRDGELLLVQPISVTGPDHPATVRAVLAVRTADGSRETDPPVGADVPEVVGWEIGGAWIAGDTATASPGVEASIWIRPGTDTVVDIGVSVLQGGAA